MNQAINGYLKNTYSWLYNENKRKRVASQEIIDVLLISTIVLFLFFSFVRVIALYMKEVALFPNELIDTSSFKA